MTEDDSTYASIPAADPHKVRYYHGRITREEAEKRLTQSGSVDGLYLLRDHLFHDAYYVLSVHYKGDITHYVILRNFQDGTVSLAGSERKFTGPIELVSYYSRNPSRLKCQQLKTPRLVPVGVSTATFEGLSPEELKQEMVSIALMHKLSKDEIRKTWSSPKRPEFERLTRKFLHQKRDWFHGAISKKKAEKRLMVSGCRDGTYMVWLKSRTAVYFLSLCYKGSIIHYPIKMETVLGQVSIDVSEAKSFDSLMLLIDYYQKQREILASLLIEPCDVKEHTQKRLHDVRILISGPLPEIFKKILEIDDLDSINFSNRGERPRYIPIEDGMESVSKAVTGNGLATGARTGGSNKSGRVSPSLEDNNSRVFTNGHSTDNHKQSDVDNKIPTSDKNKHHRKKVRDARAALYADVHRTPPTSPRAARNDAVPANGNQQQYTDMLHMANRLRASTVIPPLDPIREGTEDDATSVTSRVSSTISSAVEAIGPVISNPQGNYRLCLIRVPEDGPTGGLDILPNVSSLTPTSDYQSSDASDNTVTPDGDSADNTIERQSRRHARETRVHFAEFHSSEI